MGRKVQPKRESRADMVADYLQAAMVRFIVFLFWGSVVIHWAEMCAGVSGGCKEKGGRVGGERVTKGWLLTRVAFFANR